MIDLFYALCALACSLITLGVAGYFAKRVFFEPAKPPCQSCGSFIFCAIDQVSKCPKLKQPSLWQRLQKKP